MPKDNLEEYVKMQYRKLGKSDLKVSEIAFGCWAIGGWMWGPADDNESIQAIQRALELGINFFDTADIYGHGHSEEILASALENRRREVIIATKVGVRYENKKFRIDLSPEYIKQALDASLKRLRTDYIDLYQVHWPDLNTPLEVTFEALNECVKQGKIRYIGVSNFNSEQLIESLKYSKIISHQPPLNLFKRDYEISVIPYCFKENIGVIPYSPMAKGLLTGKYQSDAVLEDMARAGDPLFKGRAFKRNLAIIEALKRFAEKSNKNVAQLAIAWVLSHPAVTAVLCGARCSTQIETSVGAVGWRFSQKELSKIETILATTTA